jgi:hypothetical protein
MTEENRLEASETEVLLAVLASKRKEVTGGRRNMHKEELQIFTNDQIS